MPQAECSVWFFYCNTTNYSIFVYVTLIRKVKTIKMKRLLLTFFLLTTFLTAGFTRQEENQVKISRMEIDFWPDYDRPQMLVIYRVQISVDTRLPVRISLRMPAEAGSPYKVATRDLDGLLYNVEYSLEPQGSWKQLVLTTSSNELYIEYYDPRIVKDDDERSFAFSWICDYPIDKLVVKAQQPRNSENFLLSPPMGTGELNIVDDLIYYTHDFGPLPGGTTFNSQLSYTRTNSELSASNLPIAAATPMIQNSGFGHSVSAVMNQVLDNQGLVVSSVLILSGIVLMLVVSIFAGSWTTPFTNRIIRFFKKTNPDEELAVHVQYCPHCGKRTNPGDRYCRGCGNTI
jgi:hypothetical protein